MTKFIVGKVYISKRKICEWKVKSINKETFTASIRHYNSKESWRSGAITYNIKHEQEDLSLKPGQSKGHGLKYYLKEMAK